MNPHAFFAAMLAAIVGCSSGNKGDPITEVLPAGLYRVDMHGDRWPDFDLYVNGSEVQISGYDTYSKIDGGKLEGHFRIAVNGSLHRIGFTINRSGGVTLTHSPFTWRGIARLVTGVN